MQTADAKPPLPWAHCPPFLRHAIQQREGNISSAEDVTGETGTHLAVRLKVGGGNVFVKALRDGDPGPFQRESAVAKAVLRVAPTLRWTDHVRDPDTGTPWHLIAFDSILRRRPDLAPGSRDLETVGQTMRVAATCRAPQPPFPLYVDRFGDLASADDRKFLHGTATVHGDPGPHTLRVTDQSAWLTNWGHATAGPPWIDAATLAIRLITHHDHTPEQARTWLSTQPAWFAALAFGALSYIRLNSTIDPANEANYRELLTYWV